MAVVVGQGDGEFREGGAFGQMGAMALRLWGKGGMKRLRRGDWLEGLGVREDE